MIKRLFLALFIVSPVWATYTPNMGLNLIDDGVTPWGQGVRDNWSIIDSSSAVLPIDLGSDVTGTLPSENMVSTAVFTNKQNVFTTQNDFQAITASSVSVSGNVNVSGLTSGRCVQTGTGGLLTVTGAACSGGGGGASLLGVNQNGTQVTSPTFALNGLSPPFLITSVGAGATAQWTLDFSSVTGRGTQVINLQNSLQTGATFYVSSGTANRFTANNIIASTLTVTGTSTLDSARVVGAGGLAIDSLSASQCVQTGAGGLLTVTGGACGGAPGGSSTQVQYNNGGNFAGSALQTIGASSITFTTVSSATYSGFSTMTIAGMWVDGATSTMTFSSGTVNVLSVVSFLGAGGAVSTFGGEVFQALGCTGCVNTPLGLFYSAGATDDNSIRVQNGTGYVDWSIVGTAGFPTGSVAGDAQVSVSGATKKLWIVNGAGRLASFGNTDGLQMYGALPIGFVTRTKAQIAATTPGIVGQTYYCSDCTALRVCISTGTATGAFSSPVAATTACQ